MRNLHRLPADRNRLQLNRENNGHQAGQETHDQGNAISPESCRNRSESESKKLSSIIKCLNIRHRLHTLFRFIVSRVENRERNPGGSGNSCQEAAENYKPHTLRKNQAE